MSILDEYIKDFDEWVDMMNSNRDAIMASFPTEKFTGYTAGSSVSGSMIVRIPWNDEVIGAQIQALEDAGYRETWRSQVTSDGNMTIRFYKDGGDVTLIVNPDLPQSTCHKVKVGEETKTTAIYEVVCND